MVLLLAVQGEAPTRAARLGADDPFFTVEGAKAFLTDPPKAELHLLDAGHFALEEEDDFIADRIREFLGRAKGKAVPK